MQGFARGGLGPLHSYVRGRQLMLQHFSSRTTGIMDTLGQSGRAIQAQAVRHVLHMEGVARLRISSISQDTHRLLLTLST